MIIPSGKILEELFLINFIYKHQGFKQLSVPHPNFRFTSCKYPELEINKS
jgi:hypothetical protein